MLKPNRRTMLVAMLFALVAGSASVRAQTLVYDPSNYAQNVLQAARALLQINNQVIGLQNQTRMLLNQARNLASLPYSRIQAIEQSLARTQQLLRQAQRIGYDVDQIDRAFQRQYAEGASASHLADDARSRWQNALAGHHDALRLQAGVVQSLDTTRSETVTLVSASQSAVGVLQASQAGNQLIALQARQLADLTALLAAQSRAQSLDSARTLASQEQARLQLQQFLGNGRGGYQPQTVRLFQR